MFIAEIVVAGVILITVVGVLPIVLKEVQRIINDNPHDDVDIMLYKYKDDEDSDE